MIAAQRPKEESLPTDLKYTKPTRFRETGVSVVCWLIATIALTLLPGPVDLKWASGLFLFAPLVLIPLALPLIATPDRTFSHTRMWVILQRAVAPASILLAIAFLLRTGLPAGLMAAPWLITTGLIALLGLLDCRAWKKHSIERLCEIVAMMFLPIGGGWAVMSRCGITVLGFSDIIVLATAVHFHYAGFLLPVLTSRMLREVRGRCIRVVATLTLPAVAALAAGITLSSFGYRYPEWIAALCLAVIAGIIAIAQFQLANHSFRGVQRLLLNLSALSLLLAMAMAILFATGLFRGVHIWGIDIPWMLRTHGVINVFGYALCGLLAWSLTPSESVAESFSESTASP